MRPHGANEIAQPPATGHLVHRVPFSAQTRGLIRATHDNGPARLVPNRPINRRISGIIKPTLSKA